MIYTSRFTFIDLFAGIGGFRLGFEAAGAACVFSSEWDLYAQKTYEANFGERPDGDITKIQLDDIPDHDILTAGFPCQPFSIAGVTKHNSLGSAHGFQHPTQGTLFFDVVRIIKEKRPKAFILENVKNLISHDKGRTFRVILDTLVSSPKPVDDWRAIRSPGSCVGAVCSFLTAISTPLATRQPARSSRSCCTSSRRKRRRLPRCEPRTSSSATRLPA